MPPDDESCWLRLVGFDLSIESVGAFLEYYMCVIFFRMACI